MVLPAGGPRTLLGAGAGEGNAIAVGGASGLDPRHPPLDSTGHTRDAQAP